MQSAYEVLSDPQERAWYDSHRDTILRNDEVSEEHYEHSVRITTSNDLLRMFTKLNGQLEFSDSPTGFYSIARGTFDTLAREEELACEWEGLDPITYPSFGHANDTYDDVVRPFYVTWNGFATKKTFSWEDVYRYSEAPDRRVRRMMEKENKRFRDEGIREFNEAVRSLIAFVKKRDPRFKPNTQTEAERQKILRDAATAQAARSRAANHAKQVQHEAVPDWMKPAESQETGDHESDVDDVTKEQVECVVCKKSFKSEKQYEAHERSRKHVRAVQHLRRQMQREDERLRLDENEDTSIAQQAAARNAAQSVEATEGPRHEGEVRDETVDRATDLYSLEHDPDPILSKDLADFEEGPSRSGNEDINGHEFFESTLDDEYMARENLEEHTLYGHNGCNTAPSPQPTHADIDDISKILASGILNGDSDTNSQPKVGKAKEKRAKKAAQKSTANVGSSAEFKCAVCQAVFASKTRLFTHINEFGHAQPVSKPVKCGKGKKRRNA